MELEQVLKSTRLKLHDPVTGAVLFYDRDVKLWCVIAPESLAGERLHEYEEFEYASTEMGIYLAW